MTGLFLGLLCLCASQLATLAVVWHLLQVQRDHRLRLQALERPGHPVVVRRGAR